MEFGRDQNIVSVRLLDQFNGNLFIALGYVAPDHFGINTLDKAIRVRHPAPSVVT